MRTSQRATEWHFPCSDYVTLICRVSQSVNRASVCYLHFSETKKTPLFKQYMTKAINRIFTKYVLLDQHSYTNALLLWLNNTHARPDEMISHISISYCCILRDWILLSWEKSGKYRNEVPYELSFLSLFIYSCTSVSYPSLFSRTWQVTHFFWHEMNSEQYLNWAFTD